MKSRRGFFWAVAGFVWAVTLFVLSVFVGCGGLFSEDEERESEQDDEIECVRSAECDGADEECIDGQCVAEQDCTEDSDCGDGQSCDDGDCVDDQGEEPECESDAECEVWEECEEATGECVDRACDSIDDCDVAEGTICVDGSCQQGTTCQINDGCSTDDVGCYEDGAGGQGVCIPVGADCQEANDCSEQWVCAPDGCSNECVADRACALEGDTTGVCVDETCERACTTSGDCPEDMECVDETYCGESSSDYYTVEIQDMTSLVDRCDDTTHGYSTPGAKLMYVQLFDEDMNLITTGHIDEWTPSETDFPAEPLDIFNGIAPSYLSENNSCPDFQTFPHGDDIDMMVESNFHPDAVYPMGCDATVDIGFYAADGTPISIEDGHTITVGEYGAGCAGEAEDEIGYPPQVGDDVYSVTLCYDDPQAGDDLSGQTCDVELSGSGLSGIVSLEVELD